jgi:hypothetical protein
MEQFKNNIFITLINNTNEIINALVLALSIKKLNIIIKLNVITNIKLNKKLKEILYTYYDKVIFDDKITNENINTINNKNINQYEKIIFINCKSLLIKNIFSCSKNLIKNNNEYLLFISDNINDNNKNNKILYGIDINNYDEYDIVFFIKIQFDVINDINNKAIQLWYYFYKELLNINENLQNNILFKQTNEILCNFLIPLSHIQINKTKNNLLNKYYHTNISKEYDDNNIMFDDYDKPIKKDYTNVINYCGQNNITVILILNNEQINDDIKKNIILSKNIEIDNKTMKNIIFNVNTNITYTERNKIINEQYKNNKYKIQIIFIKTLENLNIEINNNNIIILSNNNNKIKIASLFNKNSLKMYKKINFMDFYINNELDCLKYQSIKKWIYLNYNGNQLQNIIIDLDFYNLDRKITIYDNNKYEILEMKKIKIRLIEFININFISYNKKNFLIALNKLYDEKKYWLLDGIKIMLYE